MPEPKIHTIVDYPREALENPGIPMPSTAAIGIIKPDDIKQFADGGLLLYQDNEIFPMKGLRTPERLYASEVIKKFIKSWLVVFSSPPWKWFERWIITLGSLCESQVSRLWLTPPEKWYSPATQEIQRTLFALIGNYDFSDPSVIYKQTQKEGLTLDQFRLIEAKVRIVKTLAVILEVDPPYRWKVQDGFYGVNFADAKRHPARQAWNFMNTLAEHDKARNWKSIAWLVWFVVLLWPKARWFVKNFAKEVNQRKLWFDEADLYYNLRNGDEKSGYDYLGLDREKRGELWEKMVKEVLERIKNENVVK